MRLPRCTHRREGFVSVLCVLGPRAESNRQRGESALTATCLVVCHHLMGGGQMANDAAARARRRAAAASTREVRGRQPLAEWGPTRGVAARVATNRQNQG